MLFLRNFIKHPLVKLVSEYLGFMLIIAAMVAGFLITSVRQYSTSPLVWRDGLGRELFESPWFIRSVDNLWAGWIWFFADIFIFYGGIFVGFLLITYGTRRP